MDHFENDTTCVYAAVTRPKKKVLLNGVLQKDATYGNTRFKRNENTERENNSSRCSGKQILHDVDSPCKCSELEEVYDDTACNTHASSYSELEKTACITSSCSELEETVCITSSPRKDAKNVSSELESQSDCSCHFPNKNNAEERIYRGHQTSLRETNSQFYYTLEKCTA